MPPRASVNVAMKKRAVSAWRWLQRCGGASWPAVFLHSHLRLLSRQTLQHHFAQFGLVLKVVAGSCGRCWILYFASRATASRVVGVTQQIGGRELCPQLVDKATAKQFWKSVDGGYLCDFCTPFAERDSEDGLVIWEGEGDGEGMEEGEEEEGETEAEEVPCNNPTRTRRPAGHVLVQAVRRERRSLLLLRRLKGQAARTMFEREKQSFECLQRLRRSDSLALALSGKERASLALLRHLREADGEARQLTRKEKASLRLLRLLRETAGKGRE